MDWWTGARSEGLIHGVLVSFWLVDLRFLSPLLVFIICGSLENGALELEDIRMLRKIDMDVSDR